MRYSRNFPQISDEFLSYIFLLNLYIPSSDLLSRFDHSLLNVSALPQKSLLYLCFSVSIILFIYLTFNFTLPLSLFIYLSTYLPRYLSSYLPIYLPTQLPSYVATYLATYLTSYLPSYLATNLPTNISVYLHTTFLVCCFNIISIPA